MRKQAWAHRWWSELTTQPLPFPLFIKQKQLRHCPRRPVNHTGEQDAPPSSSYTHLLLSPFCFLFFFCLHMEWPSLRVWSPAVLCRWLQLNVCLKGSHAGRSEQSHLPIRYAGQSALQRLFVCHHQSFHFSSICHNRARQHKALICRDVRVKSRWSHFYAVRLISLVRVDMDVQRRQG